MEDMELREAAEALMKQYMKGYDCSHDARHVNRVARTALRLAETIPGTDLEVVEMGALFHDLIDHKYINAHGGSVEQRLNDVRSLLTRYGIDNERIKSIITIIESVGYTREKTLRKQGQWTEWHQKNPDFACVCDADKLDAIGAFGVMRVAAYACHVDNPLYDPDLTVESAYKHCYDKLLLLKDMMRTEKGREIAAKRHNTLKTLVEAADDEYHMRDF